MNLTLVSKRDLMKKVYTEDELGRIDTATPIHTWKEFPPNDHCMNYNAPFTYGKLDNIEEIAKERGVKLFHEVKIAFPHFDTITEAMEILRSETAHISDRRYAADVIEEAFKIESMYQLEKQD